LLFAIVVSEGLFLGTRLRLPGWFRASYYLILAVFFLYPPSLSDVVGQPRSEALMWGLFGFSPVAGLAFLTLLPAIRRGPAYVASNGSPWRWPLYPWVLFGLLAFAVPARAFLLCWSMHLLEGGDRDRLIFGPYFLAPFGMTLAIILLEISIISRSRRTMTTALAVPAVLVLLNLVGHREDRIYQGFLSIFTTRLGSDPLTLTLLGAVGFYGVAAVRRVPLALGALTAALLGLAFSGPDTILGGDWVLQRPAPLLVLAALQIGLGAWKRSLGRCLVGTAALIASIALVIPNDTSFAYGREIVVFHLALIGVLVVGAIYDNELARFLRMVGGAMVLMACMAVIFASFAPPPGLPSWTIEAYPLALATLLAGYAMLLRHRPSFIVPGLVLVLWLTMAGWKVYVALRAIVAGLDHLVVSLALFALAILVSLAKAGRLSPWLGPWGSKPTSLANLPEPAANGLGEGIWSEGSGVLSEAVQPEGWDRQGPGPTDLAI
jgi:hypothetical protein